MTTLNLIEIKSQAMIEVRLIKTQGDNVIGFHRTTIAPAHDPDRILSAVNADLKKIGADAIADSDWNPVRSMVTTFHTPAVIAEFQKASEETAIDKLLAPITIAQEP